MIICVWNLSHDVKDKDLVDHFSSYGQVTFASANQIGDIGRSLGFGLIDMPNVVEANASIAGLHGKDIKGQRITVQERKPGKAYVSPSADKDVRNWLTSHSRYQVRFA